MIMMAAMLAMIAVMGLITFRFVTDDTIKTEDDIRNYFGATVLAVVPLHEEEEQGKHHHRHHRKKDGEKLIWNTFQISTRLSIATSTGHGPMRKPMLKSISGLRN